MLVLLPTSSLIPSIFSLEYHYFHYLLYMTPYLITFALIFTYLKLLTLLLEILHTVPRPKLYRCGTLKTCTLFDMFVFVWQLYQLHLVFIPNMNEYSPCQYQLPTAPTYSLSPSCQQNKTTLILRFINERLHVNMQAQTQSCIQYINQNKCTQ